jgi:hypothetical protein
MQLFQGRLFGGQGWWSRYGEPVNSQALSQAESLPPAVDKTAPIAPMSDYGDGYVYSQGACDCSPPCIWHLWNGYFQNPKRCRPHAMQHFAAYSGNGSCGACGNGCGAGGNGCGTYGNACGTCGGNQAAGCGCKPVCGKCRPCHLTNAWRCFAAHWNCGCGCDSCSASVGCGTATPTVEMPNEKQALQGLPTPLPEEALLHPLPRLN